MIMSNIFRYQAFCDRFWKTWREICINGRYSVVPKTRNLSSHFPEWNLLRIWSSKGSNLLLNEIKQYETRRRLIGARHNFYMISDNTIVSFGIVDCSLCTRGIALKDDYHKRRLDKLVYTPLEFNFLKILANTLIISGKQTKASKK